LQGGPLEHVIAAKAVAFGEALDGRFAEYGRQVVVNARRLCNALISNGYNVVSGGTDNHCFLLDLSNTALTGKEADAALGQAGITVNKNMVPFDKRSPLVTSGIRIGTPAVTTRGMREAEMDRIAAFIDRALKNSANETELSAIHREVRQFAGHFPLFAH
jgi:glycine hydroxymethyltransferase